MKLKFLKRKIIIIPTIIIILIAGAVFAVKATKAKKELLRISKLAPVKVAKGRFIIKTQAAGTVEPENRVEIAPSVSGRVEEMLVKEGDLVKKGQILALISTTERAALLDSLNNESSSEKERALIEEAYNMMPVIASIDGMIIKRAVEPGQSVGPSRGVVVISDRLIIKTSVDEADIGSIKKNQKAEFYLDSFPKDKYLGKVLSIAHEATLKEGVTVYEVKILPRKFISVLRSGMTADVLIVTSIKNSALYLPKKAITYRDGDAFVTVKEKKKVKEKKIEIGVTNEKRIEITDGIIENDTVYYSTGIADESSSIIIGAH
jgi:membrane fusion protein, macrolide-specific efflux system